ncbi:acetyl-CoA decarbonylase/synthase, CODH/ACS complex subunit gamma, partial [Candidatus Hakubella thermalkaliphila]
MAAGLAVVGNKKPLTHAANAQNYEAFVALAKNHGCPLAIDEPGGLDKLADLVEKVRALGVQDLVLDPGSSSLKDSLRDLVYIRRSALLKKFRSLGFP